MTDPTAQTRPRHILVTGGAGFLGQHLGRAIRASFPDCLITAVDLRATEWANSTSNLVFGPDQSGKAPILAGHRVGLASGGLVRYVNADITDEDAVERLFSSSDIPVDVVIHTASPHINAPKKVLYNVNVDGTDVLLRASRKALVKAFVYTSSASVVMDRHLELVNADEEWRVADNEEISPEYYSLTKAWAEQSVLAANDRNSSRPFLTVAIRPAGIFGEADAQVLPGMIAASKGGKTGVVIGADINRFDFTYVGNIAHAHVLAAVKLVEKHNQIVDGSVEKVESGEMADNQPIDRLTSPAQKMLQHTSQDPVARPSSRIDGHAFFITNDEPVYFWDFARAVWFHCGDYRPCWRQTSLPAWFALGIASIGEGVCSLLGRPAPSLTRSKAQFSTITRTFNIEKAKTRLGYSPQIGLAEALSRSMAWHLGAKSQS